MLGDVLLWGCVNFRGKTVPFDTYLMQQRNFIHRKWELMNKVSESHKLQEVFHLNSNKSVKTAVLNQ